MPLRQPLKGQAMASLQQQMDDLRKKIEGERRRRSRIMQVSQGIADEEERKRVGVVAPPRPEEIHPWSGPRGEFVMGSGPRDGGQPDEQPQKRVFMDAFQIDKYETTIGRYAGISWLASRRSRPSIGVKWTQTPTSIETCP